MEKKQLVVLGLSASPASNNAYALILKEVDGKRRLPIIIGAFEAQAIALEMEGVIPPRPMTHDLIKSMIEAFEITLTEVYINELKEGTFFAKLIFDDDVMELDARPSDAIALAVRCNAPIFVNSEVLDETGIIPQGEEVAEDDDLPKATDQDEPTEPKRPRTRLEELQDQMDKAVTSEDYELAAKIRDDIKKFLENT
jgi:bifunctional DNase/RNase